MTKQVRKFTKNVIILEFIEFIFYFTSIIKNQKVFDFQAQILFLKKKPDWIFVKISYIASFFNIIFKYKLISRDRFLRNIHITAAKHK